MARAIRLFVSCSPDLAPEREAIGRMVAGLPVSVGWELDYTPLPPEDRNAGLIAASQADIVLVLLGRDFAAPMGAEWNAATTADPITGHKPALLAIRKSVNLSPSAALHLRESKACGTQWEIFQTPDELSAIVLPRLAQILLDRQTMFGLELPEVEGLLAVAGSTPHTESPTDSRRGAGQGGVILGRGNI